MNNLRNRVQLIGNIGNAPEIKNLNGDKTLAKFSMATSDTYKNKDGEKVTETQWHNIIAWGSTAKVIEKYTSKGSRIAIEGKLTTNSWEDKEGNKRYTTEIVASEVMLLNSSKE